MLRNVNDVLGKNMMRDVLNCGGLAEHEAEVPPNNTKRIDLWFAPTEEKRAAAESRFAGILARITDEPAVIELWTDPPGMDDYRTAMMKRELWREGLEIRDKRPWPCPMLWHISAGKPQTVFDQFGYEPADISGWYRPMRPGLRVQVIVIPELPKARNTVLLRLLGRGRVRREALRELRALPDDAWEKQLAQPWLVRLGLEVPLDLWALPEDREFVMDIQAWWKEKHRQLEVEFEEKYKREAAVYAEELVAKKVEAQVATRLKEERRRLEAQRVQERQQLEAQRAQERQQLEAQRVQERQNAELAQLVHLFEHRFGRSLTSEEQTVLVFRLQTHGSTYLADLVLDSTREQLQTWLAAAT